MHYSPSTALAIVLCLVTLILLLSALIGCETVRAIDQNLWGTNPDPAAPQEGIAPPVIETVAAILAAIGYPGMAYWIHRNRKNGRTITTDLAARVDALEKDRTADLKG